MPKKLQIYLLTKLPSNHLYQCPLLRFSSRDNDLVAVRLLLECLGD